MGGSVSGLTGSGLVLQDSGGDNLSIASGASVFTFATPVATSAAYAVTVLTQPANVVNSTDNTNGSVSAFTINATTGALTAIAGGNVAAHTKPTGIVIDSHQAVPLIYVDNATSASDAPALGAAVDPTSTLLFTTASSANLLDVYSVAADATATAVANGPYATGNDPRGVVVWGTDRHQSGSVRPICLLRKHHRWFRVSLHGERRRVDVE
jgi:hypothetical protein